ncbi:hypothetical protein [uncultured Methanobrevibacter sp.]|nr:hypothetical protein [uncultured Methanobrevibacter sp.]
MIQKTKTVTSDIVNSKEFIEITHVNLIVTSLSRDLIFNNTI